MTKEPTAFGRVRNMLRAHAIAKGTPDSMRATNVLDHLGKEWKRVVNKGTSMTLVEVELDEAGALVVVGRALRCAGEHRQDRRAAI